MLIRSSVRSRVVCDGDLCLERDVMLLDVVEDNLVEVERGIEYGVQIVGVEWTIHSWESVTWVVGSGKI